MEGAAIKGIRHFVDTYGAVDMLFDVMVENRAPGRVATGRLTTIEELT